MMYLRKRLKNGEVTWQVDMLLDEYKRCERLSLNLSAFVHLLNGEEPAPHLMEGL